jgi:hypothetical protein
MIVTPSATPMTHSKNRFIRLASKNLPMRKATRAMKTGA